MSELDENYPDGSMRQGIGLIAATISPVPIAVGISGMNEHEASSPKEALGSTDIGREMFLTKEDIAPGALAIAGLGLAIGGLWAMLKRPRTK